MVTAYLNNNFFSLTNLSKLLLSKKEKAMMLRGCMLVLASIFFIRAHAQVDPRKVDKQVKDPVTKERAAKADRHVSKDRSIYDTSITAAKEKKQKKVRKKASCN